jgi:hypothetical protein
MLYTLTLRDGSTLDVEAPEGASKEELARAASQQARRQRFEGTPYGERLAAREERSRQRQEDLAAQRAEYEEYLNRPEELGVLGSLRTGFGAGAVDVGETATLGALTLLDEEQELAARERVKGFAEALRPDRGDPNDLSYKIGQTFGSIAGIAVPAAAAVYAGAPAAVGTGIAALLGIGAGAGEASERAREAGATEEQRAAATRRGALIGSTEALPLSRIFRRLSNDLGEETVETIRDRLVRAGKTGGEEAVQEAGANILQNLNERGYNAEQAILEGSGEAGALGGFAGGTLQLFIDAVTGGRRGGRTPTGVEGQGALPAPEETLALPAPARALPAPDIQVGPEGTARTVEQRQAELEQQQAAVNRARLEEQRAEEERIAALQDTRIPFSEQRTAEEYQAAQERAREREALRAAERGDVEAFEQPDLFALEREQERRRLGTPTAAPEADVEAPLPSPSPQQRDLVDEIAALEEADRVREQEQAQQTEAARVRAESDLETITGQQETKQRKATESRRNKILQGVIEKTPSRNYNRLSRVYSDALAAEGITNTQPTEAELQTIQRAVNVQRAERPGPPKPTRGEEVTPPPEATQLEEMEARIPEEGTQRAPVQPSLPGFGRKQRLGQAPAPAAEPAPAANPVTAEMLDQMGISAKSPIRRRVLGKDINDPTTRKILSSFATQPRTSQAAELGISRALEGVSADQPDLFTPRRGGRRTAQPPTAPAAPTPTPTTTATVPEAVSTEQAPAARETQEAPDVTAPVAERTRTSVPSGGRGMGGRRGPRGTGPSAAEPTAPRRGRLGVRDETAPRPAEPTGEQRATLTRPTMPVLETGKRTRALAPEPTKKRTATRTGTTKAGVEAKLLDAYDANTSADHKRFVKSMAVESIADPMTVNDKETVLRLLNTKSNKQVKNTTGAVQKYLGAYEDPILGLQDAIDDVVSGAANFRKAEDMTVTEVAFFGPDNARYLPARGKNSAQATLDWAAANLSPQTKQWMQTAIRDAKAMNTNVEAFQSTDLVAKRRELEALFKDGFDVNNEANALALEEVMKKLGIDESDPMLRSMMYKGSLFSMGAAPSRIPLSQVTRSLIRAGDLAGALRSIAATTEDAEVRAVAEKLAKNVGDTKVKIVKSIDAMAGVAGRFTWADNTIQLAEFAGFEPGTDTKVDGLNVHVLLHEMTHAATVATLEKKSHPLTRKIQKIFDETKDYAPTAYGFTNIKEFVAEAFTNPEFQRMLAGLKVEGDPLTPFAKFKAAISNFLRTLIGKKPAPVESALAQTTSIIDNILAPHPDKIGNGEYFMISPRAAGQRVASMLGDVQKTAKPVTKDFVQKFADQTIEFIKSDKKNRVLLGFYPSQAVADVAERNGITGAMDLHKLMEEQRGAVNKSDQEVEATLKNVSNWVKAHKDQVDTLNRVVYKSTIEQVDPSKPVSAYRNDPEKAKAWKDMRADWRALSSTGGDKIYAQMRDTYKKQYEKMRDVIFGKIDETITDEAARKKLKNEVYSRLFETGTIEPYFPLTRSGNYWLSYNDPNGEFTVEAFETLAERDRAITDLSNEGIKADKFVNISNANYSKAPPSSFVGQTLQTLRANKVSDEVQAEIMRLFVEALPETSFAKSLQRRKGTPGYKEDAIHALKTKAFDLGRQVERLRYSAKIRDLQDKIEEDNAANLTEENKYIVDELQKRADFARNPPADGIAQTANRAAFIFTIGFNASSAIVNLSQVPLFVYPMLSGKYGYGATGRAIKNASKLVTSSGFSRKSDMVAPYGKEKNIKVRATPSLDNYFELDANNEYVIRKDLELDDEVRAQLDEIKPLMEMMAARGQLNRSLFADNLGVDSSGRERSIADTVSAASAFMFHNVEVYNRQVTALTAYQLELERLKTAEPSLSTADRQQKAAEQALYDTQMTNGGSVLETAPRFGQQGIGRVALMYKTYGLQMYYSMFKTVRDGIDAHYAGDKAARNQAFRQFAGVTGASFLLAGVVGMPLAREIMQLLDLFRDDEEDDIETVVRKAIGEGFYKGPLTALLGVDVSSRIGLSGLILQANRFNHDASLEEDVFHYLGGPAWSVISSYNRGFKDIMNGEVERGIEAMLPGGVRNAYQGVFRFPRDEGILTRRGDFIMDDISMGQLAAKAIGFAPAEYTRNQEMNQQTKRIDRATNATRTKLLRKYYVATRMGDSDGRRQAMQKIRDFNKRHPTARIGLESLLRSMRQHMETSATMYNGITISPNMRRALEESRNEWDQGWQLF